MNKQDLLPHLEEGDELITTRNVTLTTRDKPAGHCCTMSEPVSVSAGTPMKFVGYYHWGSDSGPGFPEFEVKFPHRVERLHASGRGMEHWGRIVKGWCESA